MTNPDGTALDIRQPFHKHPALSTEIDRMLKTGVIGSYYEWDRFLTALNAAITEGDRLLYRQKSADASIAISREVASIACLAIRICQKHDRQPEWTEAENTLVEAIGAHQLARRRGR